MVFLERFGLSSPSATSSVAGREFQFPAENAEPDLLRKYLGNAPVFTHSSGGLTLGRRGGAELEQEMSASLEFPRILEAALARR